MFRFKQLVNRSVFNSFKQTSNVCSSELFSKSFVLSAFRSFHEITKQIKKRPSRKKWNEQFLTDNGNYNVFAYATSEEYNLEGLVAGLVKQDLYEPKRFYSTDLMAVEPDVLYVKAKYKVGEEPRDIFFFREGTVVLWNVSEMESSNVLSFLKNYEQNKYEENLVQSESEFMPYSYVGEDSQAHLKEGHIFLTKDENYLEKYTFSNCLSLSVKLGIWESALEKYVESMEYVTDDLKKGAKIRISRAEMLRKTGELFALKHLINLDSDLLDTPDFYWDREQLENLYSHTAAYLSISRRTRVMNEKLNHCVELAELISSNLHDNLNIRLEWMIIILIMVEVLFEVIHYAERYIGSHEQHVDVQITN